MSDMIPFDFDGARVRTVLLDGEPWFVANDVCAVLDIGNSRMAVGRLDEVDRGVSEADTLGGRQALNIVSEPGLYVLIFTSAKPEARRFRRWVTAEVLPALRRTGRYAMPGLDAQDPAPRTPPEEPVFGFSVAERDQWLRLVRETRLLYGEGPARRVYAQGPFASLIADPGSLRGDPHLSDGTAFLRACVEVTGAARHRIPAADLGRAYNAWRRAQGWPEMSANAAGRQLNQLVGSYVDPATGCMFDRIKSGVAMFVGLRLRAD